MKLIALSTNKEFIEFLSSHESALEKDFSLDLVIEDNAKKALAQRDMTSSLFLIDLDFKKEASNLREVIKGLDNCKWIGLSQTLGPKDFRKIQMEDFAPDALLKLPLETDDFFDTLRNFVGVSDGLKMGDVTDPSQSGLNFLGLNDEVSVDEEEDLSLKEISLADEVKLTLNEHHEMGEIEESLNSKTNARIQNKFDLAFSDDNTLNLESESLSLSDENSSLSLAPESDLSEAKENQGISLNLGESTSSSLSSPTMLPGLKISPLDSSVDEDKTIKVEDDIGRLDITSTGIKFKKSDLQNVKDFKDEEEDSSPSMQPFKFEQHQTESIVNGEEDLHLNFSNVPDISSTEQKNEDLSLIDDDATVLTANFDLPEIKLAAEDEPPAIELTTVGEVGDDAQTMATIIDPMSTRKSVSTSSNDETSVDLDNSFNEFKSGLDQTHIDPDLARENFTIDTDLLEKDKGDLGFNLDGEESSSTPSSTTKGKDKTSFQHENLEEQVRDRNLYMDDLGRLKATIHDLREERETFTDKILKLESENESLMSENRTIRAELEELKAEMKLIHTRNNMRVEDLRKEIDLLHDKKILIEEKNKALRNEIAKLEQKTKIDLNQVRQREKELESQLDLVKMDTESQVYTRDTKILELKKKIDALEFNMENMAIKEQKVLEDKIKLEERLNKIMSTLRGSIKVLEEDVDVDQDV